MHYNPKAVPYSDKYTELVEAVYTAVRWLFLIFLIQCINAMICHQNKISWAILRCGTLHLEMSGNRFNQVELGKLLIFQDILSCNFAQSAFRTLTAIY